MALTAAFAVVIPEPAEARRGGYTRIIRQPADGSPLTIVVSLKEQRLQVFDSAGLVAQSPISSGRPGYSTPTGVFTILQKNREHYSNLYGDAPMPNMQRITWSGVALHAGALPGYPASHGCIRLPYGFSRSLFSMTQLGTRVVVNNNMVEPEPFRHPMLFAALPPGEADIPPPVRPVEGQADSSAAAGLGNVSAMLGVTPAAAAEAAMRVAARPMGSGPDVGNAKVPQQRTRIMATAERQAAIDESAAAIKGMEAVHAEAADHIAEVNGRLNAARQDLKGARLALPQLKRAADHAKREIEKAERRLKDFIQQQTREMSRMEAREEQRMKEHLADAGSDLASEVLLKRADERSAAHALDAQQRDEAALTESRLEGAYLDAIHDLELAQRFVSEQDGIIERRETRVQEVAQELIGVRKAYATARNALDAAIADHKRAIAALKQFAKPATVFVSRRTGKLVIRQGYEEVYAAPVKITFPTSRIGTHVFTATRFADRSETILDWQAMTLTSVSPELPQRAHRNGSDAAEAEELAPAPSAGNALERIEMSDETKMRIVELMKPGSAFIISDEGASPETGLYTDIIVQPRS
ncbi:MAG: L,D-transpeptidase family protein [Hyphomicrobiaceae bacterium]|nr:L,D-transpeptidase family protein [Hyphomicrobiaceae bacterium]